MTLRVSLKSGTQWVNFSNQIKFITIQQQIKSAQVKKETKRTMILKGEVDHKMSLIPPTRNYRQKLRKINFINKPLKM